VSALAKHNIPGRDIKDSAEHCREHAAFVVRCENPVNGGKHLVGFAKTLASVFSRVLATIMYSAAGTPLSERPQSGNTDSSRHKKEIVEVAPTSLAGTIEA